MLKNFEDKDLEKIMNDNSQSIHNKIVAELELKKRKGVKK